LDYVVRPEIEVKPEAEDPAEVYETVDQEMTARVPHTGRAFVNDRRKVWDIISNICAKHSLFLYIKPALRTMNGREAYMLLFDHFLGPNNVGNMTSAEDTKLTGTLYNGEKKRFTWETYVRIPTEQHSVLNGLKDYGYAVIDDSSKVHHLFKGIKTTELDVCNVQVMSIPSLHYDFAAKVVLWKVKTKLTPMSLSLTVSGSMLKSTLMLTFFCLRLASLWVHFAKIKLNESTDFKFS
jgi:hypothetical protein